LQSVQSIYNHFFVQVGSLRSLTNLAAILSVWFVYNCNQVLFNKMLSYIYLLHHVIQL